MFFHHLPILLILLVLPFFLHAAVESKKPKLQLMFSEDGREWVKVREENLNGQELVEFMLKNESPATWTELVTLQSFASDQIEPKSLFDLFMRDLEQQVGGGKITHKIIEQNDTHVMAEWSLDGTQNNQRELIRIMKKDGVVAIVRYTTKKERVTDKTFNTWVKIIKGAVISTQT